MALASSSLTTTSRSPEKTASEIRNDGGTAIALECDVTKDEALVALVMPTFDGVGHALDQRRLFADLMRHVACFVLGSEAADVA